MFNPLTPADVVSAIGVTVRRATRGGLSSDFAQDQMKSVVSASRHLEVELSSYQEVIREFVFEAVLRLGAGTGDADLDVELSALAAELQKVADGQGLGAPLAECLALLHDSDSPAATDLLDDLRTLMRALTDREVDLLAAGLS